MYKGEGCFALGGKDGSTCSQIPSHHPSKDPEGSVYGTTDVGSYNHEQDYNNQVLTRGA
ncbi:hypothetical protein L195_g003762 [Trifolium pratense]|uniref:Uncharacterized protein n=1 Tax=Trifolium pratense TaxID=57577 RepID=A0A2K3NW58_TRIPR|nr:hypothetical protein L195_g003762 [Trifolium pratense]